MEGDSEILGRFQSLFDILASISSMTQGHSFFFPWGREVLLDWNIDINLLHDWRFKCL